MFAEPNITNQGLKETIQNTISKIEGLAPNTKNPLLKHLYFLANKLEHGNFKIANTARLEALLEGAARLIHNLELAKEAVGIAVTNLNATNKPYLPVENDELECVRKNLNDVALSSQFQILKNRREQLAAQMDIPSLGEFEQNAYQKGTGVNISFWYHYALNKKASLKRGNCTEQANTAFGHLYSLAYEAAVDADKNRPFECIERIDVDNRFGGHSYLLLDRDVSQILKPKQTFSPSVFFKELAKSNSVCVVVDPWNEQNPFYPVTDIKDNMPACGLTGVFNIEFGLSLSADREDILEQFCESQERDLETRLMCKL